MGRLGIVHPPSQQPKKADGETSNGQAPLPEHRRECRPGQPAMSGGVGRRPALAAIAAAALAQRAAAQQPGRTGRAIVGFPPGGTADAVTRLYVERMRAAMGSQVIVDNRPGAGGRLALELLKPLPADGSAFVVTP